MNRIILLLLPAIITMGMSGCAAYNNEAMPKAAVETRSPAPDGDKRENVIPVTATPGPRDTIVEIGDTLDVIVAEDHSFSGCYEVRRGGYFILPAVGRVDAAGLSLKQIEAKVSKALEFTQLPRATVKVEKLNGYHSGRER
jgi:hypothetical protein